VLDILTGDSWDETSSGDSIHEYWIKSLIFLD